MACRRWTLAVNRGSTRSAATGAPSISIVSRAGTVTVRARLRPASFSGMASESPGASDRVRTYQRAVSASRAPTESGSDRADTSRAAAGLSPEPTFRPG